MKVYRSVLSSATIIFFASTTGVQGKPKRVKGFNAHSVPRYSFPGMPSTTVAVADSNPVTSSTFLFRRGLGVGPIDSEMSPSSASPGSSAGDSGSFDFVDECLMACETSGGIAAGDLISPPASIEDWYAAKDLYCCDGGASYLKVVYIGGNNQTGLLTFDPETAAGHSTCDLVHQQMFNVAKKSGASSSNSDYELRFVPCNDECVLEPLSVSGKACSNSFDSMVVKNGTEVCFAAVDISTNTILFDQEMGIDVYVYFIPDGDLNSEALVGTISTSCSKPVVPPYAASLFDPCHADKADILLNLDSYSGNSPYLAFLDGISSNYYKYALNVLGDAHQQKFDISFGNCGCTCEDFQPPSSASPIFESILPTISPSDHPSESIVTNPPIYSSSAPLVQPSIEPSSLTPTESVDVNLGPGSPGHGNCVPRCAKFVLENCVFADEASDHLGNRACDVSHDFSGFSDDSDVGEHSRIEAIEDFLANLH
jgi:hypothetical protein